MRTVNGVTATLSQRKIVRVWALMVEHRRAQSCRTVLAPKRRTLHQDKTPASGNALVALIIVHIILGQQQVLRRRGKASAAAADR